MTSQSEYPERQWELYRQTAYELEKPLTLMWEHFPRWLSASELPGTEKQHSTGGLVF